MPDPWRRQGFGDGLPPTRVHRSFDQAAVQRASLACLLSLTSLIHAHACVVLKPSSPSLAITARPFSPTKRCSGTTDLPAGARHGWLKTWRWCHFALGDLADSRQPLGDKDYALSNPSAGSCLCVFEMVVEKGPQSHKFNLKSNLKSGPTGR